MTHRDRRLCCGMQGLVVLCAAVVVAAATGLWLRRRGRRLGRSYVPGSGSSAEPGAATVALTAEDLGHPLGERATLVQFSTAFCQPCRATRRVLADVSTKLSGVTHVEVDAESQLGLVRRLDIRRTPTVLVLDAQGGIVRRASGQPRPADVIAAVGAALDA